MPRIWRYDGGTSQKYVGYDSLALPALTDVKAVEPGKGYWVYSTANLTLVPTPAIALPADSDISPLQLDELFDPFDPRFVGTDDAPYLDQMVHYAGVEDLGVDLNQNGILDAPFTQDMMLFAEGVNQQGITIANTGGGLMNWSVESTTAWLSANPPAGVTGTEFDGVQILVDRAGLQPGTQVGAFTIHAGAVTRQFIVILEVPTVAGDYRGHATVQRVNGKDIALGKVDLNLSMFNESENPAETRFRAVINRDKALLFPKDAFLNGVFYQGNDFSLTTSFETPTGDRNAPPYTTFQHSPAAYGDKDFNGDGKLDNLNPFPFPIYRQITLLGRRLTADRLEGTYIEAVENILPAGQVIYLEGTFQLDRETLDPTKKSIYNGKTTGAPVLIGGSTTFSYTNTITVPSAVQVQGVTVIVKIDFPSPSELEIRLQGPGTNATTAILFRNGTSLAPVETFSTGDFNGTIGQGNWSLIVTWVGSPEKGYFNGWELNLLGLEFFTATGRIVSTNGGTTNNIAGATVLLSGSNLLPQSDTTTNGTFAFDSLTENNYSLNISKPGYYDHNRYFRITSSNVNLGVIVLAPIEIASPILTAAPSLGFAPLNVNFTPLIPPGTLTSLGDIVSAAWNFGDGSTQAVLQAVTPLSHVFAQPGVFTAILDITGTSSSLSLTNSGIQVQASGPNVTALPGATHFIFGGGFVGSIASPLATNNIIEITPTNAVFQESKRDVAGFDIDRFPWLPPGSQPNAPLGPEDTDITAPTPPFGPGYQLYTPPTVNGLPTPDRFRMICTLGGAVFGTAPSRVGDFVLQAGRIED